jgi:hypothetical protein
MTSPPNIRSRAFYWTILALPIATSVVLMATGRWQSYWFFFRAPGAAPRQAFDESFVTALIWSLSTLPLTATAWRLGRAHIAARRLSYELLIGCREVLRLALGREQSAEQVDSFARPPRDHTWIAALFGLGVAVMVPTFFMSVLPTLRTGPGAIWLGGAGILMGAMVYCQRRASAYLIDEPRYFDLFRQYRLLNPQRYEERGRPFVRAQIICAVVLPIWWLGGGSIAFLS